MKHLLAIALGLAAVGHDARAQQIDFSRGGPVAITANDGLEWNQNEQQVVARGDAKAVRGNITVTADKLIAYYRKKATPAGGAAPVNAAPANVAAPAGATPPAGAPAGGGNTAGNEIYRLEAVGKVRIASPTETVTGGRAVYDMDQGVMLMTGGGLRLVTPNQTLTARDSLEYWAARRMSVARGNANVETSDGRRMQADTLVAFSRESNAPRRAAPTPAPATAPNAAGSPMEGIGGSGKLQRVEAFGNVVIRTQTDTVMGDRMVYMADNGLARMGGNVRITRGQNQFSGSDALVNTNTGISQLLAGSSGRVAGIVVPGETGDATADPAAVSPAPAATARPARRRGTSQ